MNRMTALTLGWLLHAVALSAQPVGVAGRWEECAPIPLPRHDLQLVAFQGRLFAISGAHDQTVADVDRYDPAANAWSPLAPIPDMRGWFGAALLDGRIYCAGGKRVRTEQEKHKSGDSSPYEYRASLNILDPAAGRWTIGPPMCAPRAGCQAVALGGKLYVLGGSEPKRGFLDRVEVFDPATNAWRDGPPLPDGREDMGAAVAEGRIYAIGGVKHSVRGEVFIYEPAAGRWTTGAPMPTPRRSFAIAVDGPLLWCIGGVPGRGYTNVVEVYDTRSNTWSAAAAHPQSKAWMGAAVLDGRLYTVGGANQDESARRYRWIGSMHRFVPVE
jgi:N-acetylneuraminic acid mutarotase